jgi:hypothetical protein
MSLGRMLIVLGLSDWARHISGSSSILASSAQQAESGWLGIIVWVRSELHFRAPAFGCRWLKSDGCHRLRSGRY